MAETNRRHIVKAISYRVFATLVSTSAAWALSHDLRVTAGVTVVDVIGKLILYYLHERVWNRIGWGRMAESDEHRPDREAASGRERSFALASATAEAQQ